MPLTERKRWRVSTSAGKATPFRKAPNKVVFRRVLRFMVFNTVAQATSDHHHSGSFRLCSPPERGHQKNTLAPKSGQVRKRLHKCPTRRPTGQGNTPTAQPRQNSQPGTSEKAAMPGRHRGESGKERGIYEYEFSFYEIYIGRFPARFPDVSRQGSRHFSGLSSMKMGRGSRQPRQNPGNSREENALRPSRTQKNRLGRAGWAVLVLVLVLGQAARLVNFTTFPALRPSR